MCGAGGRGGREMRESLEAHVWLVPAAVVPGAAFSPGPWVPDGDEVEGQQGGAREAGGGPGGGGAVKSGDRQVHIHEGVSSGPSPGTSLERSTRVLVRRGEQGCGHRVPPLRHWEGPEIQTWF